MEGYLALDHRDQIAFDRFQILFGATRHDEVRDFPKTVRYCFHLGLPLSKSQDLLRRWLLWVSLLT